jgi:hypothetical protein
VLVEWNDETLRMTLVADDYPAVELWQAERNAIALVAEVFGREVYLDSTAAPEHLFAPEAESTPGPLDAP